MRANQGKYCSLRLEILSVSCGGHFVTVPAQRYCECVCVFCLLYNAPAVKLLASGPLKHKEPVGGLLLFAFTHTPSIPVNMVVNGFQSAAAFC